MSRITSRAIRTALWVTIASLTSPTPLTAAEPAPDAWFASHAFIAMDECVAVGTGQTLKTGDRVSTFEAGQPVSERRIMDVVDADSAKPVFDRLHFQGVYGDKPLWGRIGCFWGLRAFAAPFRLAHLDPEGAPAADDGSGAPLVIEGLAATAIRIGSDGSPLDPAELGRLKIQLDSSSRREFSGAKTLCAGIRYHPVEGHTLTEVYFGYPFYHRGIGEAPIDSIHILRLVLHNGREISFQQWIRISGQEEHVDQEPPQLDENNWWQTSVETLGFLSLDGGRSWLRLDRDGGFEGIDWAVWRLSGEDQLLWDLYLYTAH